MLENVLNKSIIVLIYIYAFLTVVLLITVVYISAGTYYKATREELIINDMLNKLAQLIITSSIGISAIAFTRSNKNNLKKEILINLIILIVVISFDLFLFQYIITPDTLWAKKVFMIVNVVIYLIILVSLTINIPSKPKQIGTSKPIKEKNLLTRIFNK